MVVSKIKILRITKGMNQQQLAERLGVTQGAISQWEQGYANPSSKFIPKLAGILGCTPDELIPQVNEKTS